MLNEVRLWVCITTYNNNYPVDYFSIDIKKYIEGYYRNAKNPNHTTFVVAADPSIQVLQTRNKNTAVIQKLHYEITIKHGIVHFWLCTFIWLVQSVEMRFSFFFGQIKMVELDRSFPLVEELVNSRSANSNYHFSSVYASFIM